MGHLVLRPVELQHPPALGKEGHEAEEEEEDSEGEKLKEPVPGEGVLGALHQPVHQPRRQHQDQEEEEATQ